MPLQNPLFCEGMRIPSEAPAIDARSSSAKSLTLCFGILQIDDQGLVNTDPRYIAVPNAWVNLIPTDLRGLTYSRTPEMVSAFMTCLSQSPSIEERTPSFSHRTSIVHAVCAWASVHLKYAPPELLHHHPECCHLCACVPPIVQSSTIVVSQHVQLT